MAEHPITSALRWAKGKERQDNQSWKMVLWRGGAGMWSCSWQCCNTGESQGAHLRGWSPRQILTLGFLIPASSAEKKVELEWTYLHHGFYCWNRERLRYKKKQASMKFVLLSLPPQCSSSSVWVGATNERRPAVRSHSLRTVHYCSVPSTQEHLYEISSCKHHYYRSIFSHCTASKFL